MILIVFMVMTIVGLGSLVSLAFDIRFLLQQICNILNTKTK